MVKVAVEHQFRLYHLRGNVLAVRCFEQVLDALAQKEFAILHISRIARVEPPVGIDGLLGLRVFFVVARRDGLAAEQYLIVLAKLYLYLVNKAAYRPYCDGLARYVARHGGQALGQTIAHHHVDAGGMGKHLHLGRHGGAGCGEEVGTLQAQRLAQQLDNGFVVKLVLQAQAHRGILALRLVVYPVALAHLERLAYEFALHKRAVLHLFEHGLVHLFPKSGHGTHTRGVHLLHGALHVGRTQVDALQCTLGQAQVAPCTLKDVGVGQEVEKHIVLAQGQHGIVHAEALTVLAVGEHHALALPGGATGVEYVAQVVVVGIGLTLFVFIFQGLRNATSQFLFQEIGKVHRQVVGGVFLHLGVEYDDALERARHRYHTECHVVLLLFAYKQEAHLRIVEHVGYLCSTACGIKWYGHRAYAVGTKVNIVSFRFVLREYGNILLHSHAQAQQCKGHLLHIQGKLLPRHGHPLVEVVIAITERGTVAVLFGLLKNEL